MGGGSTVGQMGGSEHDAALAKQAERHRRDVEGARARKARKDAAAKARESKPKLVKRVKL